MTSDLERAERNRFVEYCRVEAATLKGIIEQMEKIGSIPPQVITHHKIKAAAYSLVANDLARIEEDSI